MKHCPEPSLRERLGKLARRHPTLCSATSIAIIGSLLIALLVATTVVVFDNVQEMDARLRLPLFDRDFTECQFLLNTVSGSREHLREGIRKAEQTLGELVVNAGPEPRYRDWMRRLTSDEQNHVREQLAETLHAGRPCSRHPGDSAWLGSRRPPSLQAGPCKSRASDEDCACHPRRPLRRARVVPRPPGRRQAGRRPIARSRPASSRQRATTSRCSAVRSWPAAILPTPKKPCGRPRTSTGHRSGPGFSWGTATTPSAGFWNRPATSPSARCAARSFPGSTSTEAWPSPRPAA